MKNFSLILSFSLACLITSFANAHHQYSYGYDPAFCENVCPSSYHNWSFSAEALFWKACEDGLAYGTQVRVTPIGTNFRIDSRIKKPHFKWDTGFRLGLNYNLPCDCWGLAFYWTHFHTHTHSHHRSPATDTDYFIPGFGTSTFGSLGQAPITDTTARWKKNVELFDVELGRPFCFNHCLTLRPHIGIRAAWIRDTYRIRNKAPFETASNQVTDTEQDIQRLKLRNDYEAIGLRAGLDSQWDLGCGISLYSKAALSALYGHYDIKNRIVHLLFGGEPSENQVLAQTVHVEQKDSFCACRGISDLAVGLRWRACFCNDTIILTINVGWEQHLFINLNEFEQIAQLNEAPSFQRDEEKNPQFHRGDLCLRGFTIGTRVDF